MASHLFPTVIICSCNQRFGGGVGVVVQPSRQQFQHAVGLFLEHCSSEHCCASKNVLVSCMLCSAAVDVSTLYHHLTVECVDFAGSADSELERVKRHYRAAIFGTSDAPTFVVRRSADDDDGHGGAARQMHISDMLERKSEKKLELMLDCSRCDNRVPISCAADHASRMHSDVSQSEVFALSESVVDAGASSNFMAPSIAHHSRASTKSFATQTDALEEVVLATDGGSGAGGGELAAESGSVQDVSGGDEEIDASPPESDRNRIVKGGRQATDSGRQGPQAQEESGAAAPELGGKSKVHMTRGRAGQEGVTLGHMCDRSHGKGQLRMQCARPFRTKKELYSHYRLVHNNAPAIPCGLCSFVAAGRSKLAAHMKSHNGFGVDISDAKRVEDEGSNFMTTVIQDTGGIVTPSGNARPRGSRRRARFRSKSNEKGRPEQGASHSVSDVGVAGGDKAPLTTPGGLFGTYVTSKEVCQMTTSAPSTSAAKTRSRPQRSGAASSSGASARATKAVARATKRVVVAEPPPPPSHKRARVDASPKIKVEAASSPRGDYTEGGETQSASVYARKRKPNTTVLSVTPDSHDESASEPYYSGSNQ